MEFSRNLLLFPGYSDAALQYLNRVTLSRRDADAAARLINTLVSSGIWQVLDYLYLLAAPDSATSLLNVVPTTFGPCTINLSPTFTEYKGWNGTDTTSTTGNLVTSLVMSSGVNFTQNSAHFSAYCLSNIKAVNGGMISGYNSNSSSARIFAEFSDGNAYFDVNDAVAVSSVANANTIGHFLANRSGAAATQGYARGGQILTSAQTSSAPIAQSIGICSGTGAAPFSSSIPIGAASAGGSLTAQQAFVFHQALTDWLNVLGAVNP